MNRKNNYGHYMEKFFEIVNPKEKSTYSNLFNRLEDSGKFIADWKNKDLDNFMKILGGISENTISKYLQYTRDIYKFICEQENKNPRHLFLSYDIKEYIDIERLKSLTINEYQYKTLTQIAVVYGAKGEMNFRDKILIKLAWEGLSSDEIRHLKIKDIDFYEEYGKEKVRLNLRNRKVEISNEDMINDLKKCINEKEYWMVQKNREYAIPYKETPNLIKPVAMRQSNKNEVADPSRLLKGLFRKLDAESSLPRYKNMPQIDLSNLNLGDIKRSRLIHELKDENADLDYIAERFGRGGNNSDLYWLKNFALNIKKIEKENS